MIRATHQCPIAASLRCAAALLIFLFAASAAQAVTYEFANIHLLDASKPLTFTNGGEGSATLQALSVPVIFNFTTESGLSTGDHAATLTINPTGTAATTTPAAVFGSLLDQVIQPITFSIIENGTGKNLLSMSATHGDIVGMNNALNAGLSGVNTNVFSSFFGTFTPNNQSFNFGLTTLSTPLSVGPGGFLNSFIANINGQFSVDTSGFNPTPEPASVVLLGMGVLTAAVFARRKSRRLARSR